MAGYCRISHITRRRCRHKHEIDVSLATLEKIGKCLASLPLVRYWITALMNSENVYKLQTSSEEGNNWHQPSVILVRDALHGDKFQVHECGYCQKT